MTHHNEISMQSCLGLFIKLPSHIPWADRRGPLAVGRSPWAAYRGPWADLRGPWADLRGQVEDKMSGFSLHEGVRRLGKSD